MLLGARVQKHLKSSLTNRKVLENVHLEVYTHQFPFNKTRVKKQGNYFFLCLFTTVVPVFYLSCFYEVFSNNTKMWRFFASYLNNAGRERLESHYHAWAVTITRYKHQSLSLKHSSCDSQFISRVRLSLFEWRKR